MTNFFKQRSVFLMTAFFVFCENNAMDSLIPYNFCGKMIKKNPIYEKISVANQPGSFLSRDTCVEIGIQFLDVNNKHSFVLNSILNKWIQDFSLNQYIIFIEYVRKIINKTKIIPDLVLRIIEEADKNEEEYDFYTGVKSVKLYHSIINKVQSSKKYVLSVEEYTFLNTKLGNKFMIFANGDKVRVEKTFAERLEITPKQLIKNIVMATVDNLIVCFFLEMGVFCVQTRSMTLEQVEQAGYENFGILNARLIKCSEMCFLLGKAYYVYQKKNDPIKKIYALNDHF